MWFSGDRAIRENAPVTTTPRRRTPALAKTRGPLLITRRDGTQTRIGKGDATKAARLTRDAAYERTGRNAYD